MAGVLLLLVLPAVFFLALDAVLFRKPPAWVVAAAERVGRILRPPPPVVHDPFDTLEVQHRLAALADEIQRLEADHRVFARAHRIKVAQDAYDAVLGDACRLAGVRPEVQGPAERTRGELELAARGWFW